MTEPEPEIIKKPSRLRRICWFSLAVVVLLLFLGGRGGGARSTLVVALAIPISVIGSFLVITLMGRTINVIMLAGMAFAVGMVVDASIVVLENIDRRADGYGDNAISCVDLAKKFVGIESPADTESVPAVSSD